MRIHAKSHRCAGARAQFVVLLIEGAQLMRTSELDSPPYVDGRDRYNVAFNWLVSTGGLRPSQVLKLASTRKQKEARR